MHPDMNTLHFISISGRPSSGKDTQANLLVQQYSDAEVVSTGDIFRGASQPDGQYGKYYPLIEPFVRDVNQGSLLPDEIIVSIVEEVVREKIEAGLRTIIFTGFPRTISQLDEYREWLKRFENDFKVRSDFLCLAVLEGRSRHLADVRRGTPGVLAREDDQPQTVDRRLAVYREQTLPMLKKLAVEGELKIIRSNRDIESIHADADVYLSQAEYSPSVLRHSERQ